MRIAVCAIAASLLFGVAANHSEASELPELSFPVGEALKYKVYWGVVRVGSCYVGTQWSEDDGEKRIVINTRTRSTSVLDKIYPVNDRIESIIDPTTFTSLKFTKNLSEGRHRYHEITVFDREAGMAHWKSLTKDRTSSYEINDEVRDILCFMYHMRAQEMRAKQEYDFEVMADEKIYGLKVRTQSAEQVKLPRYGTVKCLKMVPEATFQGLFVRKGKMEIWISQDERRLCTKMAVSIPVAKVRLVLDRVSGPGDDFWVRGR